MSLNRFSPHLLILTEDNANRAIVNGFLMDERIHQRRVQALNASGGWIKVKEKFLQDYYPSMERYHHRHVLLVIDSDGDANRIPAMLEDIPETVRSRTFIIGTLETPERLASLVKEKAENIGRRLAQDCVENTTATWSHSHLQHNSDELQRLNAVVRHFLLEE